MTQHDALKHLASAMWKVLPPDLLRQVVEHLDPLSPFVAFLRDYDAGEWCNEEGHDRRGVYEIEERDEPYVCTLPRGHAGHHVAEDVSGRVKGCWPAEPPATKEARARGGCAPGTGAG